MQENILSADKNVTIVLDGRKELLTIALHIDEIMSITKGSRVQRIAGDYTNGRTGTVLETATHRRTLPDRQGGHTEEFERARVQWDSRNESGKTITPPRTWVEISPKTLKLIDAAV